MVSILAIIVCILFVAYVFWVEHKKNEKVSKGIWIPMAWMFLAGSRYVSSWLNLGAGQLSVRSYEDGSPLDATVFLLLILMGSFVLYRRKIEWHRLLVENKLVVWYLGYCLISILWSDIPGVSLKRYVKELGNMIMVLIVLTDEHPYEALTTLLRRLAFLLLPLSVVFVRYYPELGRSYNISGGQMFTGIGSQKNSLGLMCLFSGVYFLWYFLVDQKGRVDWKSRNSIIALVMIAIIVYLLYMSRSATSLICLTVAVGLFLMARIPIMARNSRNVLLFVVVSAISYLCLDAVWGVEKEILQLLGRDETFTNRTSLWEAVKAMHTNALIGTGFMSFWSGTRMEMLWMELGEGVNQAHNGYLEQYLNLGYIGVAFIVAIILSGIVKVNRYFREQYGPATLRLIFIVIAILYNYTEASFYGLNNMWLLLLFGVISPPQPAYAPATTRPITLCRG